MHERRKTHFGALKCALAKGHQCGSSALRVLVYLHVEAMNILRAIFLTSAPDGICAQQLVYVHRGICQMARVMAERGGSITCLEEQWFNASRYVLDQLLYVHTQVQSKKR